MKTNTIFYVLLMATGLVGCASEASTGLDTQEESRTVMHTHKKGYQLYTIREELTSDSAIAAALAKTSEMGYVQVESFGYMDGAFFGQQPDQFKKTINDASLASPSGHYLPMELAGDKVVPIDTANIAKMLDAAEALGQQWVIVPWMSEAWRTESGYMHLVEYIKTLSAMCKERGLIAGWHNHEFEFEPLDNGTIPYDYLIENLKDHGVVFEMDLHWVAFAGEDPVEWFNKYPGMFPLWHVKDFAADTLNQVPVGQGVIDWERIFAHAELSGMEHYYIEQDVCSADRALDCLEESLAWAKEQDFMD